MFRRRKYGIAEATKDVPVSMFYFELLYADGQDLTRLPYRLYTTNRGERPRGLAVS
jgi:ATP-dependent DNA ligase